MTGQNQRVAVIIVAAGSGSRMGTAGTLPKQYQRLGNTAVLARTMDAFVKCTVIDQVLPIIGADHMALYQHLGLESAKILPPVIGGADRQTSVLNGLKALNAQSQKPDIVLIHDAARPFVSTLLIEAVIHTAHENGAALPALQVTDTLKFASTNGLVQETRDRTLHYLAQTPQGFRFEAILQAHNEAATVHTSFTDDASIAEWAGLNVKIVDGDPDNFKLTIPEDFKRAEMILHTPMETRVGTGFDVHAFEAGDHVILGGIPIPHTAKLKGHSDADVALHTLTDALYGAMADGDIGQHFPPSEMQWHQADSAIFLEHAVARLREQNGRLVHLDLTLICEAPKIGPYCGQMRQRIAQIANISVSRVSVKATTTEKLGFTGRNEGIAAQAAVTIEVPVKD